MQEHDRQSSGAKKPFAQSTLAIKLLAVAEIRNMFGRTKRQDASVYLHWLGIPYYCQHGKLTHIKTLIACADCTSTTINQHHSQSQSKQRIYKRTDARWTLQPWLPRGTCRDSQQNTCLKSLKKQDFTILTNITIPWPALAYKFPTSNKFYQTSHPN